MAEALTTRITAYMRRHLGEADLVRLVGIVVIFIRGVCTELVTGYLIRREGKTELFDRFDAEYAEAAAGGAK